ncbi:MAG: hypothetical protein QM479_05800 [Pseudomonadota bacterium]
MSIKFSISLVTHFSKLEQVEQTLLHLIKSCQFAFSQGNLFKVEIFLIDNSVNIDYFKKLSAISNSLNIKFNPLIHIICNQLDKNIGYGKGHNTVINTINSNYHLIINPDIDIGKNAINLCISYIQNNPKIGMITPLAVNGSGEQLYLNKRYPNVLILLIRGFFPLLLSNYFSKLSHCYEMRDVPLERNESIIISSGCFMFFRSDDLKRIGGFSEQFFLYFEDFDLTYRFSSMKKIAFLPEVKTIHYGGYSASKGIKHIFFFMRSAIIFFNRFGWKLY